MGRLKAKSRSRVLQTQNNINIKTRRAPKKRGVQIFAATREGESRLVNQNHFSCVRRGEK